MNYGFLIDNRNCIGCHACTTACKAENEVPLGVNRTWVKYVEKGVFPDSRRFFQVTRCNHCANPPCVHICPVTAMFQRPDGIVEFDPERCIGCKACIQACPYDAIYMDPDSHTAAKCHFCAHRIEVGLEPACVVVCPTHAIIAGDLDDPGSEIARLLQKHPVRARKPEQNTLPKLFYIGAEEVSIVPGAADATGGQLWSQAPDQPGSDWRGPLRIGESNVATALMRSAARPREVYNAPQRIPWHWQVPAYLTTKAAGSGAFLVAAAGLALGLLPAAPLFTVVAPLLALLLTAVTTGLLVWDLDRPERFWTILIRPQWRSWLARGAFILVAFSAVALFYLAAVVMPGVGAVREPPLRWLAAVEPPLLWLGVILAALAAVYTAFLFAQAEGRDLWQSPLLPWHMLVQAVMAGSAALLLAGLFWPPGAAAQRALAWTFALSLGLNLLLTAGGDFAVPHATGVAAVAARMITHGRYRRHYRAALVAGLALPLLLVAAAPGAAVAVAAAALLAIAGLFVYEWAYVMAPQQVPNS